MPEEVAAPQFTRFVSSVEGRLVARWDAIGSHFGARVATFDERKAGAEPYTWDTDCVVPLTAAFCAKYDRELRNAFRNGDLTPRTEGDYAAWLKLEETRESEHIAALEAAKAEAAKAAEAPAPPAAPEPTPPTEAEPAKTGRKKPQQ